MRSTFFPSLIALALHHSVHAHHYKSTTGVCNNFKLENITKPDSADLGSCQNMTEMLLEDPSWGYVLTASDEPQGLGSWGTCGFFASVEENQEVPLTHADMAAIIFAVLEFATDGKLGATGDGEFSRILKPQHYSYFPRASP